MKGRSTKAVRMGKEARRRRDRGTCTRECDPGQVSGSSSQLVTHIDSIQGCPIVHQTSEMPCKVKRENRLWVWRN